MTDKQIIIDGVDVSGCEFYHDGKCLCEFTEIDRKIFRYYSCKKFPDCYYKQLKRKEQECERLTSTLTEIKEIAEENDELLQGYYKEWANNKLILQKISECEGNDEN